MSNRESLPQRENTAGNAKLVVDPTCELISVFADRYLMSAVMPELRTPVMTLVEASWKDSDGASHKITARMEDKSAGGACIRVKTPIRVGSQIRIQWRFDQFTGTARYCRNDAREYLVGIQRDNVNSPVAKHPFQGNSANPTSRKPEPESRSRIFATLKM